MKHALVLDVNAKIVFDSEMEALFSQLSTEEVSTKIREIEDDMRDIILSNADEGESRKVVVNVRFEEVSE